jgi:hypothetical protein
MSELVFSLRGLDFASIQQVHEANVECKMRGYKNRFDLSPAGIFIYDDGS